MKLIFSDLAANVLETRNRMSPNCALRLALLGPPGSGKINFSESIQQQAPDHARWRGEQAHVRVDAGQCNSFEFDDAHARILAAMRIGIENLVGSEAPLDIKDATIKFVPNVRKLLAEWNGHMFLYLDRLELLSGNLIRSLGNSFRELLEAEGADETPDRFHLVWSGVISLFALRSRENSALAMCEPITFPVQDSTFRERAVTAACNQTDIAPLDPEALQALITTSGGEPGFLSLLLHELKQRTHHDKTISSEGILQVRDTLVEYGWQIPELRRIGTWLLADEHLSDLGRRLVEGKPAYRMEPIADIDRYQLSGVVVTQDEPHFGRYVWRNGVVEAFCRRLLASSKKRGKKGASKANSEHKNADVPTIIGHVRQQLQQLREPSTACEIMASCWTPLTNYPNFATFSIAVGDLRTDAAYVAEIKQEPHIRQTSFSALVPYLTPAAWELCRTNLFVGCNEQESVAVLGIPAQGIDCLVLARINRSWLQRQLTEYDLSPWAALICAASVTLVEAVLADVGAALIRGKFKNPSSAERGIGATTERAELTFLVQEASLMHRGKSKPYAGSSFDREWLDGIHNQCLDLSKFITSQKEYRRRLAALSKEVSKYIGDKWQGLAYDVASLPDGVPLKIVHSVELLRMPFELLRSGVSYLSLERPVSRHILDYHPSQPYEIVLRALKADRKEPFRAVIVASHKSSNLGRAHEELTIVRERVHAWCHTHNVPPETRILEGPEASCEQLEVILRSLGRVHLLHFCGHCTHNTEEPENSSLAFLDKQGNYDNVNCRKLQHVLEEAQIWLLFLSCCYSGAAASGGIVGGGLSGVVHAALAARIANILSYRWEVSDNGALQFASHFYERLFSDHPCSLSEVILDCRRKADGARSGFDVWASPMLITNNSA